MRTITLIVVHCSATKAGLDYTVEDIDAWHRQRGFRSIGYHYVIYRDGSIHAGRPEEKVGAHCKNHNSHSIGVCYIGGLDSEGRPCDTRTTAQKASLHHLLQQLHRSYPHALIVGHHDLNPMKACPCFDAVAEYKSIVEESDDEVDTIRSDTLVPTAPPAASEPHDSNYLIPYLMMVHFLILVVAIVLVLKMKEKKSR